MDSGFLLLTILHYPGTCLGSPPWPPLHLLDAVVAMRSESRAGPRAIATVIFYTYCIVALLYYIHPSRKGNEPIRVPYDACRHACPLDGRKVRSENP
jgi:hypothetical protein